MRVLLPLKKKQDDPNFEESLDTAEETAGDNNAALVETTTATDCEAAVTEVDAEEPESTDHNNYHNNNSYLETSVSPTAVLLSAAAARLSCLPAQLSPSSSSEDFHSSKEPAVESGLENEESSKAEPSSRSNSPVVVDKKPEFLPPESTDTVTETENLHPAETVESIVDTNSNSNLNLQPAEEFSSTTLFDTTKVAPDPTSLVAVPSTPTTTRLRKRRSSSPSEDSKPPSKKGRDSKPPAKRTPDKVMAGGRGGRKLWAGPSYYVETTTGREDVSASDDSAELDVRFSYRPEAARATASASATSSAQLHSRDDDDDVREPVMNPRPTVVDEQQQFAAALKKQGLEIVEQEGDGNCLFRAISLQVYGDASMHEEVRQRCLDFMARDKEHFSQFITDEPFEQYIRRKRQDGVHGNNPEIQAISELFNRPIEVFVPENGASPLNIFHAEYKTQDAPIRLSYHDGNHYNAVIDPLVPTAGLGLGLPGLQPGLADKLQMAKAVAESDRLADQREFERALEESQNDQLQRAIKESTLSVDHLYQNKAISLSDCDATNFELEQAVLESSLESFRTFEHGRKQSSSKVKSNSGRRTRQASPPHGVCAAFSGGFAGRNKDSSVASIPREARQDAGGIPMAASAASISPSVAMAPAVASRPSSNDDYRSSQAASGPLRAEHYPQTVQELVMNGFELRKVVHAYELVGDNFDELLCFLMTT